LVHEILANHEEAGFISNVDDNLPSLGLKGRFNNRVYAVTKGAWTRKGQLRFAPSEAFRLVTRKVSPIYENSCRDLLASDVTPWLRARFEGFFEERSRSQGRPYFLHKYTGWSRLGFFGEIFPEAKFVNVVRDGRAVANSWLQMDWWGGYRGPEHWPWGPLSNEMRLEWEASDRSYVVLSGLCWRLLMDSYRSAAGSLGPDRYMEIRYEDFLGAPEQTLRRIVDFIGMPWSRRVAHAIGRMRLDTSRRRPFERELSPAQLGELERCLGPALERYGYA
jgi:hypothetical protein